MESFCEYVKFFSPSPLFIRVLGLFGLSLLGLVVILRVETIMLKRLPHNISMVAPVILSSHHFRAHLFYDFNDSDSQNQPVG